MEGLALTIYVLAGYSLTKSSLESAIRYFCFGSLGAGFLIFGIGLLYGATNHLDYNSFKQFLLYAPQYTINSSYFLIIGLIFIMFSFFIKLSIFPFHA